MVREFLLLVEYRRVSASSAIFDLGCSGKSLIQIVKK